MANLPSPAPTNEDAPPIVVKASSMTVDPIVAALVPVMTWLMGIAVSRGWLSSQEAATGASILAVTAVAVWRWYVSHEKTRNLVTAADAAPDAVAQVVRKSA